MGRAILKVAGDGEARLIATIMLTVGLISAFMNNVGAVAMLMPAVVGISRQTKVPVSRLLIPLAFASLLGGKMTLIGTPANLAEPGKRMLSSMTPTFVEGPHGVAILGTPGGSRIITMVLLGILDFMRGNEPESWVSLPRFHHQYMPDEISAEPDAFTPEQVEGLRAMGHEVKVRERTWGNMHGVMWNTETGEVTAGSDPRWPSGRAIVR